MVKNCLLATLVKWCLFHPSHTLSPYPKTTPSGGPSASLKSPHIYLLEVPQGRHNFSLLWWLFWDLCWGHQYRNCPPLMGASLVDNIPLCCPLLHPIPYEGWCPVVGCQSQFKVNFGKEWLFVPLKFYRLKTMSNRQTAFWRDVKITVTPHPPSKTGVPSSFFLEWILSSQRISGK